MPAIKAQRWPSFLSQGCSPSSKAISFLTCMVFFHACFSFLQTKIAQNHPFLFSYPCTSLQLSKIMLDSPHVSYSSIAAYDRGLSKNHSLDCHLPSSIRAHQPVSFRLQLLAAAYNHTQNNPSSHIRVIFPIAAAMNVPSQLFLLTWQHPEVTKGRAVRLCEGAS